MASYTAEALSAAWASALPAAQAALPAGSSVAELDALAAAFEASRALLATLVLPQELSYGTSLNSRYSYGQMAALALVGLTDPHYSPRAAGRDSVLPLQLPWGLVLEELPSLAAAVAAAPLPAAAPGEGSSAAAGPPRTFLERCADFFSFPAAAAAALPRRGVIRVLFYATPGVRYAKQGASKDKGQPTLYFRLRCPNPTVWLPGGSEPSQPVTSHCHDSAERVGEGWGGRITS